MIKLYLVLFAVIVTDTHWYVRDSALWFQSGTMQSTQLQTGLKHQTLPLHSTITRLQNHQPPAPRAPASSNHIHDDTEGIVQPNVAIIYISLLFSLNYILSLSIVFLVLYSSWSLLNCHCKERKREDP